MPTSRAGTCNNHGFTLMELVVVIAILALAAALVLPRLTPGDTAHLHRAAREFAATLRFIQDRAITAKTAYRMKLVPGESAIAIATILPDGTEGEPDDPILRRRLLPEGISIASIFTPRVGKRTAGEVVVTVGTAGFEEFSVFHLKAEGSDAVMTVMAYPSSGKVKVAEGYREEPL